MATLQSLTRLGSDHNPLVVELSPERCIRSRIFRFEEAWIKQEGFADWVRAKWPQPQGTRSIDYWQKTSNKVRSCLRGWNSNWSSDMKKRKQDLLLLIQNLDQRAEEVGLADVDWRQRYA